MRARIGSWPFHEHSRWQTRKMSIAQRPDLISPSSEPAKYANCAKNAECANCTNYDFTFFRFQLPSFLLVQRPPSTRHLCLTSRRARTSCKSRKSSRQGSDLGQLVWLVVVLMFMLMFVLICVVRFLNPVTPTSIVPLTMFQSCLMYTWATKMTDVSKCKKRLPHTGPSPCLPPRRCRGPCFQTCAFRSRQLGRVRPVTRARWGQSL